MLYGPTDANQARASLAPREDLRDQISCEVDTLDHYVESERLQRVDVIKIDVEGGELGVLTGAQRTLATFKPCVYVEVSADYLARFGSSSRDVASILRDAGYCIYRNETVENMPGRNELRLVPLPATNDLRVTGIDDYWLAVHS
jgi:hypothetical protein